MDGTFDQRRVGSSIDGTFDHERLARMLVGIYRSQSSARASAVAQQADETMKAGATTMLQTIIGKIQGLDIEIEGVLQIIRSLEANTDKASNKVYNAKIYIESRDVTALMNAKATENDYLIKYHSLKAKHAVYEELKGQLQGMLS